MSENLYRVIPVERIVPNPQQPRRQFDPTELQSLADSIREVGLLKPILVEEGEGRYILIDGERRWRAHKLNRASEIAAIIRPPLNGTGARERTILALVANLQHADLSPVEEGRAYEALAQMGMSNSAIAHKLGTYSSRVANRRSILSLEEEIIDLFDAGLMPIDQRVVAALREIPDDARVGFARKLARPGLAIKTVRAAADRYIAAVHAARVDDAEPAQVFAIRRSGAPNLPNWDVLRQLGKLPPWSEVTAAARRTCSSCELRGQASNVVCGRCPAVQLLSEMIKVTHER